MRVALATAIGIYLLGLLGLALWARGRIHSEEDFLVAGRRLPLFLSVGTLFATWFGAGTILTATDEIRDGGLRAAALEPYGAGLCLIVAGLLMAAPLRESKVLTLSDLWRERFGVRAEALGVIVSVPAFAAWVAVQLVALAGILELFFGLDQTVGIILIALVALAYTLLGGMWSVTITDTAQLLVIVSGILLLAWKVFGVLGDGDVLAGLPAMAAAADPRDLVLVPRESAAEFWRWMNLLVIGSLGNLASQDLAQRILSAESPSVARKACYISGVLYIVFGTVPVLLAIASQTLLPPELTHSVIPALAREMLSPALTVVFVLSMISVVISTITSGILAPAAILSRNALRYWVGSRVDPVRLAQVSVGIVTVMSAAFALSGERSYALLEEAYAIGLVGFFAPLLYALYAKEWSENAAISSMVVGTAVWSVQFFVDAELPVDLIATAASFAAYALHFRLGGPNARMRPETKT